MYCIYTRVYSCMNNTHEERREVACLSMYLLVYKSLIRHEFIITIIIRTLNSDTNNNNNKNKENRYTSHTTSTQNAHPCRATHAVILPISRAAKSQQLHTATLQYIHTNLVSFRINIHTRVHPQSSEQVKRIEQTSDYTINTPFPSTNSAP